MKKNKYYYPLLLCRGNALLHRITEGATLALFIFHFSFFILVSSLLSAQTLGSWLIYPAYTVCTQNIPVGNRVYALMETKLMVYDTEDESIQTFDWMRQLSDVRIQFMDYSASARRIILVYDNGNIDLLSTEDDNDVVNLSQLKSSTLQGKEVNAVYVYGQCAYLSTGFGIVVVDMEECVIQKTYQIGRMVKCCTVWNDYLYLGVPSGNTNSGVWRGKLSDNLQDPASWKRVNASLTPSRMFSYDGRVWAVIGKYIFVSNEKGTGFSTLLTDFPVNYSFAVDGKLIIGNEENINIYSSMEEYQELNGTYTWNSLTCQGETFWASDGEDGLQSYTLKNDTAFQVKVTGIHPNSPLHDYTYHLRRAGDRLLISGGNRHYASSNRDGTAMILEPDGTWRNFSAKAVAAMFPEERYRDVTNIAQDPTDPEHHYVGTTRSGIFEFRNGKPVAHIGMENSPLHTILPNDKNPQWFVVADGLQYDPDGNLWVLNSRVDTIIHIIKPDGSWQSLYFEDIAGVSTLDNYLFDSNGYVWINSRRVNGRGVIRLDYGGTISNTRDDYLFRRADITNQDGTSYSPDEFYCIVEDADGSIWIGTNLGPFVITQPKDFTADGFIFEQVKVARTDGSGLADYLLADIPVQTIAMDGAGRKWFGTQGNGVYLMSADCQEEIHHFTTENTPLPSDDITDIYIDPKTGRVYFATNGGLCSFVADAIEPVEDLQQDDVVAYPNPVKPDYSGPIVIRGLSRDSEVKILSTTGQLVWSGVSNGGLCTWDGCNQRGRRVSSGVYHVVVNTADGKKAVVTRITVIR